MTAYLDHTIVPVRDREEAVEFYSSILGFEDIGEVARFLAVRVNETLTLDFLQSEDFHSHHYAFAMDAQGFEDAFGRIRDSGIAYGDGPRDAENMKGPGQSTGAKGLGKSVYFRDPNGHMLEIRTY